MTTVMTGTFTERVEQFILESLLLGDRAGMPAPTDSLIESGVMDSTGVLELIEFLEQEFEIRVEDAETVLENLDSIQRVVDFVARKRP
ncbi:acyl carrier protein [Microbacterium aurum]